MNICLLTSSFPRTPQDPAGIFIYHLARWLAKKDIHVSVVAPHDKGCPFFEIRDNIRIYRFPYFFPFRLQKLCYGAGMMKNIQTQRPVLAQIPFFFLTELLCAAVISKKIKADIIHAHWSIPQGITGVLSKQLLNIPCITSVHGSDVFALNQPFLKPINRWALRKSDICIANSRATKNAVEILSGRNDVALIPMGVDTDLFDKTGNLETAGSDKAEKDHIILFAGRLIKVKGVDVLIRSMPKILAHIPESKLLIVGNGPQLKTLMALSKQMGVSNQVVFKRRVAPEELKKYYNLADVFVLPSIIRDTGETEGLGMVLLEAMACGVPVIGTDVGGIGDSIVHEETGLLITAGAADAIADNVIRLFKDKKFE